MVKFKLTTSTRNRNSFGFNVMLIFKFSLYFLIFTQVNYTLQSFTIRNNQIALHIYCAGLSLPSHVLPMSIGLCLSCRNLQFFHFTPRRIIFFLRNNFIRPYPHTTFWTFILPYNISTRRRSYFYGFCFCAFCLKLLRT